MKTPVERRGTPQGKEMRMFLDTVYCGIGYFAISAILWAIEKWI